MFLCAVLCVVSLSSAEVNKLSCPPDGVTDPSARIWSECVRSVPSFPLTLRFQLQFTLHPLGLQSFTAAFTACTQLFHHRIICVHLFLSCATSGTECHPPAAASAAPRTPPEHLVPLFTRCGAIALRFVYVDDTMGGAGTHWEYPRAAIDELVDGYRRQLLPASPAASSAALQRRGVARMGKLGWVADALWDTLKAAGRGARVVVFGSMQPTMEALCVAFGAAHVTTVEHNRLTYHHPQMATVTVEESRRDGAALEHAFDVALSVSSFDHDGLGRYGDPLCPDADLMAMDRVREMLKPGGTLLLTVPVGKDTVVFNLNRRYGRVRLPLLLHGWKELRRVAWDDDTRLDADPPAHANYEPVFVLQAPKQPMAWREEL